MIISNNIKHESHKVKCFKINLHYFTSYDDSNILNLPFSLEFIKVLFFFNYHKSRLFMQWSSENNRLHCEWSTAIFCFYISVLKLQLWNFKIVCFIKVIAEYLDLCQKIYNVETEYLPVFLIGTSPTYQRMYTFIRNETASKHFIGTIKSVHWQGSICHYYRNKPEK